MKPRFSLRVSLSLIGITLLWLSIRALIGLLIRQADPESISQNPPFSVNRFLHAQQLRKDKLGHFCLRHPNLSTIGTAENAKNLLANLRVNEKLRMLYCDQSSHEDDKWEELLHEIEARDDIKDLVGRNKDGRPMASNMAPGDNLTKLKEVLRTYTKVIVIRDPLERVVSSYLQNSEGERTFNDFVEDVLSLGPGHHDSSLTPLTALCQPCFIRYDFILRHDHFRGEVLYLIKTLGLLDGPFMSTVIDNGSKMAYRWMAGNLYRQLSKHNIRHLIEIFSWDFEAFPLNSSFFFKAVY